MRSWYSIFGRQYRHKQLETPYDTDIVLSNAGDWEQVLYRLQDDSTFRVASSVFNSKSYLLCEVDILLQCQVWSVKSRKKSQAGGHCLCT